MSLASAVAHVCCTRQHWRAGQDSDSLVVPVLQFRLECLYIFRLLQPTNQATNTCLLHRYVISKFDFPSFDNGVGKPKEDFAIVDMVMDYFYKYGNTVSKSPSVHKTVNLPVIVQSWD
jgi:hypothetical protein